MNKYDGVIDKMDKIVNDYHTMPEIDPNRLNLMLKELTSALYYMETVRSDIHNLWQIEVKRLISQESAVNRAENDAHIKYPDMYRLRHIMKAGYEIVGAMRTNISYLKQELNQSK